MEGFTGFEWLEAWEAAFLPVKMKIPHSLSFLFLIFLFSLKIIPIYI
jgi:hypothetical protein